MAQAPRPRARRLLALLLGLALTATAPAAAAAPAPAGGPVPQASSALLLDASSGRVLFARAAERRIDPASLAPLLTAYVALRQALAPGGGGLGALVTVPAGAASAPGPSMGLRAGDRVSVEDLVSWLLLAPGQDALAALAGWLAPTPQAFAALLERTAADLGCTATRFSSPRGRPAARQATTPLDLARLTRAALALPQFAALAGGSGRRVEPGGRSAVLPAPNLRIDGLTAGYAARAGQVAVVSAAQGGLDLIAVAVAPAGAEPQAEAAGLLRWGLRGLRAVPLPPAGRAVAQTQVRGGTAFYVDLVLPAGTPASVAVAAGEAVRVRTASPAVADPPIAAGQALGTLTVWIGGTAWASWPLLAAWAVAPAPG